MIIEHKNNGKTWLLVEVPEESMCFQCPNEMNAIYFRKINDCEVHSIIIPSGEYSSPVMAKELTEWHYLQMAESELKKIFKIYERYYLNYVTLEFTHLVAKNSFLSLLQSHNLRPETTLIIQKIT